MLLVSHDRYLVEQVATHVAHLEDDRLVVQEGVRSSDFQPEALRRQTKTKDASAGEAWAERKKRKAELGRMKKRYAQMEGEIEQAEAEVEALDEQLYAEASDHEKARQLSELREIAQARVDALYAEWETLEAALADE